MKTKLKFLILGFLSLAFVSCEDVIEIELDEGESQLVVDAFIDNVNRQQIVKLSMSTPYFDNNTKRFVQGATVRLVDQTGKTYNFADSSNGRYVYVPQIGDEFCDENKSYELIINYNGEEFFAKSNVNPVPKIDSIRIISDKNPFSGDEVKLAEFYAVDIKGRRDFYWIKSWRNDSLNKLNNPDNVSDGAFSGTGADGLPFIIPMRRTINNQEKLNSVGDSIRMELLSINEGTYDFLSDVFTQTNNGGLFAAPPNNVRTNIKNRNPNSTKKALGWFCTGRVSQAGIRVK
jgi:hypothetical protein